MDHKVVEHTSHLVANVGASITGLAALWAWLGTNHDAITATCAALGLLIAIIGACINGYGRFISPVLAKRRKK